MGDGDGRGAEVVVNEWTQKRKEWVEGALCGRDRIGSREQRRKIGENKGMEEMVNMERG